MTNRGQGTLEDLQYAVKTLVNAKIMPIRYRGKSFYFLEYREGHDPFHHLLKTGKVLLPGKRWMKKHFIRQHYEGTRIVLVRANLNERKSL